jgi:hypothetical protein
MTAARRWSRSFEGSLNSSGDHTTTQSVARSSAVANSGSRSKATNSIQQTPDSARNGERRPVGPLIAGYGGSWSTFATRVSRPVFWRR